MYVYFCERGDRVSRGGQLLFMYPFLFMYFFSFPFCELGMGVKDAGPAEGGWDRRISGRRSREREGGSKGKMEE